MDERPAEPEEAWNAYPGWLQQDYERWKGLGDQIGDAQYAQYLMRVMARPRLELIPLVEAMREHAVLRAL